MWTVGPRILMTCAQYISEGMFVNSNLWSEHACFGAVPAFSMVKQRESLQGCGFSQCNDACRNKGFRGLFYCDP